MTMKHIMLDLETLGTGSNAAIIAIGAAYFTLPTRDNLSGGTVGPLFYQSVKIQSSIDAGLSLDGATVEWWMQQSEAARNKVLGSPVPLARALSEFEAFYAGFQAEDGVLHSLFGKDEKGAERIWGHGATFDQPILANAYKRLNYRAPWGYRDARDTRTLFELTEDLGISRMERTEYGTAHCAVDDAVAQALDVINCYRQIYNRTYLTTAPILASAEMKAGLSDVPNSGPTKIWTGAYVDTKCERVVVSQTETTRVGDVETEERTTIYAPVEDDHHNDSAHGAEFPIHRPEMHPAPQPATGWWMEHKGGDCPLPDKTPHEVRFRDGRVVFDKVPQTWDWTHTGRPNDIVAYRVLRDGPPVPSAPPKHIPVG